MMTRTIMPTESGLNRIIKRQYPKMLDEDCQKMVAAIRAGDKAQAALIGVPGDVVDRYMDELQRIAVERSLPALAPAPLPPLEQQVVALIDQTRAHLAGLEELLTEIRRQTK